MKSYKCFRSSNRTPLISVYKKLYRFFGPQHWWPGETPFEVMVGAVLTQNTAWSNVEKAIRNLKVAKVLTPRKLLGIRPERLAQLIRPAGYFNVKTVRLKEFLKYLKRRNCLGNFKPFARIGTETLRKELLGVKGIGPETCDSILLYALDRPVFVVDAYTKRIFSRGGFFKDSSTYHEIQDLFKDRLPMSRRLFNEYHALIVRLGKQFCRPQARCEGCPLA